MSRPIYIFDIDGTLACTHHREHLALSKQWDAFYDLCHLDAENIDVLRILFALESTGAQIIFMTGRPERLRRKTVHWLHKYTGLPLDYLERPGTLTMRDDNDRTPDHELKRNWYRAMREFDESLDVRGVFEDRQRVVDMWREEGVTCFQVAKGDF